MKRGRNQRRRQGPNVNRALDSNGPDVRIRGTANQIYDKYQTLARDAASAGDRVKAESYLQHAEHYFRLIKSIQPANTPAPNNNASGDQPDLEDGNANSDNADEANTQSGNNAEQGDRPGGRNSRQRDGRRRRSESSERGERSPSSVEHDKVQSADNSQEGQVRDPETTDTAESAGKATEKAAKAKPESNDTDQAEATPKPVRRTRKKRTPAKETAEA